ncbi:MAG: hypothetical protein RR766_03840 [Longicatena sp.]
MKKLNVWIHCRVTNKSERYLLNYQEKKIKQIFNEDDVKIIGISKEVNAGRDPHTMALDEIRIYAQRKEIDVVIVTDKTRLLVIEERYQEFKLLCNMFDVQVVDLHHEELTFQNFLFNICS